jgi:hypothetical protein
MGSDSEAKQIESRWRNVASRVFFVVWFLSISWFFLAAIFTVEDTQVIHGSSIQGSAFVEPEARGLGSANAGNGEPARPRNLSHAYRAPLSRPEVGKLAEEAKKLKIYVYSLPKWFNVAPFKLLRKQKKLFASAHHKGADAYFHQRLMHVSSLRTENPEEADFFFVPVYTSAVAAFGTNKKVSREKIRKMILKAVSRLRLLPYWNRNDGKDHIFVFPNAYGPCIGNPLDDWRLESDTQAKMMKRIRNAIFLTYSGDANTPCFDSSKDVVIPPVVDMNRIVSHLKAQRKRLNLKSGEHPKRTQFSFIAGRMQLEKKNDPWFSIVVLYGSYEEQTLRPRVTPSKDVCWDRPDLNLEQCVATCDSELSRSRVYSHGLRQKIQQLFKRNSLLKQMEKTSMKYIDEMRTSIFCISTRGLAPYDINMYEGALVGCIPVVMIDDVEVPFEKLVPWDLMTKRVRESDASRLILKLSKTPKHWIKNAQSLLKENVYAFAYTPLSKARKEFWSLEEHGFGAQGPDAFEYTMMMLVKLKLGRKKQSFLEQAMAASNKYKNSERFRGNFLFSTKSLHFSSYLSNVDNRNPSAEKKPGPARRRVQGVQLIGPPHMSFDSTQKRLSKKYLSTSAFPRRAFVFRGRVGIGGEGQNAVFSKWRQVTAGTIVSELEITMSLALSDISEEQLQHLTKTAKAWGGYVSVGVVAMEKSVEEVASALKALSSTPNSKILFSVVKPRLRDGDGEGHYKEALETMYPINRARNAALAAVVTKTVLLWDNGFVLSPESMDGLQRTKRSVLTWRDRTAIVVPTFEFTTSNFAKKGVPSTKYNLVWNMKNEELQPYGMVGDAFKYSTHATNHKVWYESKKSVRAKYEFGYQPLMMVRTPALPFDEHFNIPYLSKMHYSYELTAAGFEFLVHATAFAVTIGDGEAAKEQQKVETTDLWTVPWSCWRQFTDRIQRDYEGFYFPEPCWVSKSIWPVVNEKHADKCVVSPIRN